MQLTTEKKSFWLQGISIEKRNKALKLVRDIAEQLKDTDVCRKNCYGA